MALYFVGGSRVQLLQLFWRRDGDKMTLDVDQITSKTQYYKVEDRYETGLRGTF